MTADGAKPTIATIAEAVGVSPATVSNAFNRPSKLSPELRVRILETADRLGYTGPNPMAAGLRRGRAGAIGVIVSDSLSYAFSDPAVGVMLDGLADVFDDAGLAILLLACGPGRRTPAPASVMQASVDGFVLYGGIEDTELEAALSRRGLPVVALAARPPRGARHRLHVDVDEEAGSRALAEHLVGLGHRRFGVVTLRSRNDGVTGPMSAERRGSIVFSATARRLAATLAVLGEHGIDADAVPVYEVDHNEPAEGATAAGWLLDQRRPPTAIVCQSDQLAFGALEAAAARGRRVPDDVSIAGFDDVDRAKRTVPPLTTVHQPLRERGQAGGELVLRALAGRPLRSTSLPTELVVRASTAPPPRRG